MIRLLLAVFFLFPSVALANQVQEIITPKGIKAWLVEEHTLPLVAMKIAFKDAGFAYDAAGKEGCAGMAAALLMEGAGDLDSQAFNEALEDHAIQLSFTVDEDMLRLALNSLSEHKDKAFYYLGLALTKPRFDATALERVRGQTLSLLTQQEQSPAYILHRAWQKMAFGTHAYAHPLLGTREAVGAMTAADFSGFAQHYLTRGNMVIGVVGDITPAELAKLLDANLGSLPEKPAPDVTVGEVALPVQARQIVTQHDIPQTMVMFGTNGIKRTDPDYYTAYVMNQVIGGGGSLTSRLGKEIRIKRGLAYGVYTGLDSMFHAGMWQGAFATRNDKVGSALDILRTTLADFAANGPTDEEMSDAKRFLTGSFVLNLDSNEDVANYLISMQLYNLGRNYFEVRNQLISAVRKEDVKRLAAKLTRPENLLVVMVGKPNLAAGAP